MTRLRWTLLLLGLGIGLPAALIISRATVSLELEKTSRHAAVAERVFDEMERSLSDFLLREESRPASDFDQLRGPGGADAPRPTSFANADEPFLLGWFVLPAGADRPRLLTAPADEPVRVERALRSVLASFDAPPAREPKRRDADRAGLDDEAALPAPGRTRALDTPRKADPRSSESELADSGLTSSYEVLQSLNRAGSLRSERQSKAFEKRSREQEDLTAPSSPPRLAEASESARRLAPASAQGSASERSGGMSEAARSGLADSGRAFSLADAEAPRDPVALPPVDPFVGRATRSGEIVLTRSAWRGARVERQGLVLDRNGLAEWLGREILRETGLAERATLDFSPGLSASQGSTTAATPEPPATAGSRASRYRYVHRFAEPFDDLSARLELAPLPGSDTAASLYTLAALLGLALVMGLFALDRMTRVVVEYAQRRSDFVAAVSHELRTPLTAIRMYAEMLRDGLVSSESKRAEYYETITDESERLSRLIDNVLEFSRLEQDRPPRDLVIGGLEDVVREAASKLDAHAQREGFQIVVDCADGSGSPGGLPRVGYDRDAMTQIVFNLVDNAIKYARDAERRSIAIRLVAVGANVELRVRDWGPGAPADQLERIFEPFYRVGEELTRATAGTGIGLALVRELARGMGASVRAETPPGGGLEVVVDMPPET